MKVKVERDGDLFVPLTSKNGKDWSGGTLMTTQEIRDYGEFLVDFAKSMEALDEIKPILNAGVFEQGRFTQQQAQDMYYLLNRVSRELTVYGDYDESVIMSVDELLKQLEKKTND